MKYIAKLDFFNFRRDSFTTELHNLFDAINCPVNFICFRIYLKNPEEI